jgi:pyruvate formate lyase activating enzyme
MTRHFNSGQIVKALFQEPLVDGRVRCHTCQRRCVIASGNTGWCRTRMVRGGRLHSLTYGRISSLSSNPLKRSR